MRAQDLLFELGTEELPPRALLDLSTALTDGVVKGLDAAGIPYGKVDQAEIQTGPVSVRFLAYTRDGGRAEATAPITFASKTPTPNASPIIVRGLLWNCSRQSVRLLTLCSKSSRLEPNSALVSSISRVIWFDFSPIRDSPSSC